VAEPFVPVHHGTALSDCSRRNPSEIPSWPALFMSASTTIADPLLRRAFGRWARPSDPHPYCTSTHRGLKAPRAGLATRLSDFATNRHEQCGLDSVSFPADSNRGDVLTGCGKTIVTTVGIQWPAHIGQQEDNAQDAQKGQTSHPPNPWRTKTRLVPNKAAASEKARVR